MKKKLRTEVNGDYTSYNPFVQQFNSLISVIVMLHPDFHTASHKDEPQIFMEHSQGKTPGNPGDSPVTFESRNDN